MELSLDMPNIAQQFNAPKRQNNDLPCSEFASCQPVFDANDTIDMSQIVFPDEETWLCQSKHKQEWDLNKWLYQNTEDPVSDDLQCNFPKTELQKNIDTRTFTRPKKRFLRPSIEKYNEELYGSDTFSDSSLNSPKKLNDSGIFLNGIPPAQDVSSLQQPLHFDLSQPNSSYYFENVVANANASNIDSFQNMSPPSLVNSMCSSTFANLMENSFIKNDPELREIRDTDYTESILQHETEPMFQSFTESFSSLNSDVPENFLKKVSINDTLRKSFTKFTDDRESAPEQEHGLNTTFNKSDCDGGIDDTLSPPVVENASTTMSDLHNAMAKVTLNGTYQRSPKLRSTSTFRVADVNNGSIKVNRTYQRSPKINNSPLKQSDILNTTITLDKSLSSDSMEDIVNLNETHVLDRTNDSSIIPQEDKTIENVKRLLSRRESPSLDLNRLSYASVEERVNATYNEQKEKAKRYSYSGSTDSAENLDYMSASSGSSKGSNKMLNMEGLNAIVAMQERSLQVMSTPKVGTKTQKLWENNIISPICNSDPELSSSNETNESEMSPLSPNSLQKQKSLGQINSGIREPLLPTHGGLKMSPGGKSRLQNMAGAIRGSYPNLKTVVNSGSQPNLMGQHRPVIQRTSRSNLNTIGPTLKGSYTSLKPSVSSSNLPVAPPPLLNNTQTISRGSRLHTHQTQTSESLIRLATENPAPRESTVKAKDVQFVKPQIPRASGLPRPVGTGIPRPASRIPGPRNVRSVEQPPGRQFHY